jgi:DNA ligase-1
MKTIKKSPILQSVAKTGKKKYWQLVAWKNGRNEHFYTKVWWQEGSKTQESAPVKVVGKNVGRENETTAREQLLKEFDSIVQKRRDKGYSEDGSADHIPIKPMLAHKYKDKKHLVTFPCWVQPKLDGFRMLMAGNGSTAWTRGGKKHVRECVEHLMWDAKLNVPIDGELILPHMPPLQETSRAAKKFRPGVSDTLIYCVYDIAAEHLSFSTRYSLLEKLVKEAPENVRLVETRKVNNEQELFEAHAHFVSEGYEGTIIRTDEHGYEVGHRSSSLLKMKDFQDAEFKIVDVVEGKGSFKGKAVFVCETDEGYRFNTAPEGTMEYRAELWRTRKDHIGKWLTIRFQALTEDGAPQFPVGVEIREEGEF